MDALEWFKQNDELQRNEGGNGDSDEQNIFEMSTTDNCVGRVPECVDPINFIRMEEMPKEYSPKYEPNLYRAARTFAWVILGVLTPLILLLTVTLTTTACLVQFLSLVWARGIARRKKETSHKEREQKDAYSNVNWKAR